MPAQPLARLTLPIAPAGAIAAALAGALAALVVPDCSFGPAQLVAAVASAVAAGLVTWAALFLLVGRRRVMLRGKPVRADGVPVLRRADAHPDAPARRPLFAEQDLGPPPPPEPAELAEPEERPLPSDLDTPLAMCDPDAVPHRPRERARLVPALARPAPLAPGERIATFAPHARPAEPVGLEVLLGRLEEGARRREPGRVAPPPIPGGSLEDALRALRQVAR